MGFLQRLTRMDERLLPAEDLEGRVVEATLFSEGLRDATLRVAAPSSIFDLAARAVH